MSLQKSYEGGFLTLSRVDSNGQPTAPGALRLLDADGSHHTTIIASSSTTANVTYTLPPADGSTGQVLRSAGDGTLTWVPNNEHAAVLVERSGEGNVEVVLSNKSDTERDPAVVFKTGATPTMRWRVGVDDSASDVFCINTAAFGTSDKLSMTAVGKLTVAGAMVASNVGSGASLATNAVVAASVPAGTANQFVVYTGANAVAAQANVTYVAGTPGTMSVGGHVGLASELRMGDANNSHYVGFKAPATVSTNRIWTLPADNVAGALTNTGGTLTWVPEKPALIHLNSWGDQTVTLSHTGNTTRIVVTRFHPSQTGPYTRITFAIDFSSGTTGTVQAGIYEAVSINGHTRYNALNPVAVSQSNFGQNSRHVQYVDCDFNPFTLRNDRSYLVAICFRTPGTQAPLVLLGETVRQEIAWIVRGDNLATIPQIDTNLSTDTTTAPWVRIS